MEYSSAIKRNEKKSRNVGESQQHCAEWRNLDSKGYVLHDSPYVTFWKKQTCRHENQIGGCQGLRFGGRGDCKVAILVAGATVTKCHQLGGLTDRNLPSRWSGGPKSATGVLSEWFFCGLGGKDLFQASLSSARGSSCLRGILRAVGVSPDFSLS